MKPLICSLLLAGLFAGCATTKSRQISNKDTRIVHSVFFTLQHQAGSFEETVFFNKAKSLVAIPGVENFQVLREVSPKNPYTYGFSMEFADQASYDSYNNHPNHVSFVQDAWVREVVAFQEIDYLVAK
ncbi:MAG: Dabb family protein [Phycisphaerae bacterium]|nr:Dabb family protein [Phycisphaerae bacterium]